MAQNKTTEHAAPRGMRLRPPPENTHPRMLPKRLRPWVSRLVIVLLAAPLSLMVSAQAAFAGEPPPAGQEGTTLEDVSPAQDPASEQGEDGPAEGEGAEPTDSNTGSEPSGGVPAAEEPVDTDNDPGSPSPRLLWGKTTVLQTALRVSPDASPGGVPEIHLGEVSPGETVSFVLVAKNFSNTTIGSKSAPGHSRIISEIGATLDEVSASCAPSPANANVRCLPSTDILPGNVVQQNWDGGKNGTIQLTVNGTLPAGTPPGEYSIRSFLPSNFENNSMNSPKPFTTSGLKTVGKAGDIREATVRFTVPVAEQVADAVLSVDPGIRVADGTDAHTARVSVENQAGEPMSGVDVVFRGAPELKLPTMPVTTNIEGIAKVAITSTVAGTHELEALINGNPVAGSPARVSFGPGSPSVGEHGKSSLAVSEGTRVADGVEQHSATATVVDAQGNPVPGLRVDFSLPPRATAKLNSSFATTNAEGKATVTATSTVAGTTAVTAQLGNSTLRNSPSEVTFVAGKPSLGAKGQSRLSATTGDQFADGSARHTVTATVLDANKNPVGATEVHFSVPAASGASLSHAVVTTDPQGVATVSVTSARAGKVPVSATVGSTALKNSPVQLSFVAKTGDPSVGKKGKSSLTVSGGDKVADGKQAHTATATVLDAKKRPVAGATVQFAVPGNSGASLSATNVKTNAQGVATVTVTSVTAGNVKVSATVNGTSLRKSPGTVSFVAGDPSVGKKGTSSLRVSGGDKVADGKQSHTATATVLDANKNPV
ncbi:Ig-like domain-containing protein, partial [Leucobacter sp. M11]|uniref:Ig-like domain-containing protein n=1 Tax=Leucobacter sp. M11 TaxID=2993565 RepID=UPI002D801409